jgi:hypothetical protein
MPKVKINQVIKFIKVKTNLGNTIELPYDSVKEFVRRYPEEYIHYEGPVVPKPVATIVFSIKGIQQLKKETSNV